MSGRSYAEGTSVSSSRTESEVKSLLLDRGAKKVATFEDRDALRYDIAFEFDGVAYRISLPLPDPEDKKFSSYKRGYSVYERVPAEARKLYDQEVNRRWRAFGAVIKAKMVAVAEGISSVEREFLGDLVLPGGRTVSETYSADLQSLAARGSLPALEMGRSK